MVACQVTSQVEVLSLLLSSENCAERTFLFVHTQLHNYIYIYIYITIHIYIYITIHTYIYIYRVSQEECARLREGVPYVRVYRYNPKHLCPKLNGYGDNGQRSLKL